MPTAPVDPPFNGDFFDGVLVALGLPQTDANKTFLHIWAQAEGGLSANSAKWNPLNTKMNAPGAVVRSNGIMDYPSEDVGVWATAQTLRLPAYAPILSAMRASDIKAAAEAVVKSPWGTLPHPLLDLVNDNNGDAVGQGVTGGIATGAADAAAKAIPSFGITDLIKSVGHLTAKLLDPKWWLRIGQGLAAAALLLIALGLIFRKQIVRATAAVATDGMSEAA